MDLSYPGLLDKSKEPPALYNALSYAGRFVCIVEALVHSHVHYSNVPCTNQISSA